MIVTEDSVQRLKAYYPGITVIARRSAVASPAWTRLTDRFPALFTGVLPGRVLAVRVPILGIKGGRSRARCRYEIIVDTHELAGAIPAVWVVSPQERDIRHVNIWPEARSFCRFAGKNLPSFCWHTFANGWSAAPQQARTLGNVLEYAKQLLNTENHDSPAR
jgi:hypothetical protein